jgi:hypothetical protein
VLVLAVAANTLGTTFGVGGQVETTLVSSPPATQALPDRIVFYSNRGFLVAGPRRDGDLPRLLQALRRSGVTVLTWSLKQSEQSDFSFEGLRPLAMIAGLSPSLETAQVTSSTVALIHESIPPGASPPCTRLSDGTGVWVVRRNPASGSVGLYCPFRDPRFYGHARFEGSR